MARAAGPSVTATSAARPGLGCYDDLELDLLLDGLSCEVRTEDQDEFGDAIRLGLIHEDEAATGRAAAEATVELSPAERRY